MTTECSWNYHENFKRRNSMNNLLSYCGLVDATISASEKDLPVLLILTSDQKWTLTIFFHISFYFRKESASKFRVIKKWH